MDTYCRTWIVNVYVKKALHAEILWAQDAYIVGTIVYIVDFTCVSISCRCKHTMYALYVVDIGCVYCRNDVHI